MALKKRRRVITLDFLATFFGLIFVSECTQFLFGETGSWTSSERLWYPDHHPVTSLQSVNQSTARLYIVDQQRIYQFRDMLTVCRQMGDVIAAIALSPCQPEKDFLGEFSHYTHLPSLTLQLFCDLNNTATTASLGRHSSPLSVPWEVGWADPSTVIATAVSREGWTEVIIIADNYTEEYYLLERLLLHLGDLGILTSVFVVNTEEEILKTVTKISTWKPPQRAIPHIVLCNMNKTRKILTQAEVVGMSRLEYFWLVYNEGKAEELYKVLKPSENIAFLHANQIGLQSFTQSLQGALSEVMRELEEQAEEYVTKHGDFRKARSDPTPSRVCPPALDEEFAREIHQKLSASSHLDINYTSTEPLYTIHSSITREIGRPVMEQVAAWWPDNTLELQDTLFPNSFFYGFNKRVFHVASLEYSFFQQKVVDENKTVVWRGLTFQLLDALAKDLNFTYVVEEPEDMQWGIDVGNGSWTGMMGMVVQKKVDFAAACFSITAARQQVADFPSPYYHDQSVVVMKRPGVKNRMLLYVYPFHWEVWAGTLGSIFLCGPVLWVLTCASPYYDIHPNPWGDYRGLFRLDNAILYIFGAFFQQGGIWLPDSQSGRMLVGCFWFFVIAVVAIYTGNLIAFLAVSTIEMPFDTLNGLVSQSNFEFGTSDGVALVMLFRDANFEPYTSVYQKMVTVPNYKEGLRRVKEGDYAFISEKSWFQGVSAMDAECEIAMMKEEFYPTSYGWALQPGSPYQELFSDKINKIRESGLLDKWIQDWTPNNTHCKGLGPVTQAKVATVTDFQGALLLLGMGLAVGLFLLVLEIGYHNTAAALLRRQRPKTPQVNGGGVNEVNGGRITECNGLTVYGSSNGSSDDLIHNSYIESMFHIQV